MMSSAAAFAPVNDRAGTPGGHASLDAIGLSGVE
jgi:hypothetical protein